MADRLLSDSFVGRVGFSCCGFPPHRSTRSCTEFCLPLPWPGRFLGLSLPSLISSRPCPRSSEERTWSNPVIFSAMPPRGTNPSTSSGPSSLDDDCPRLRNVEGDGETGLQFSVRPPGEAETEGCFVSIPGSCKRLKSPAPAVDRVAKPLPALVGDLRPCASILLDVLLLCSRSFSCCARRVRSFSFSLSKTRCLCRSFSFSRSNCTSRSRSCSLSLRCSRLSRSRSRSCKISCSLCFAASMSFSRLSPNMSTSTLSASNGMCSCTGLRSM